MGQPRKPPLHLPISVGLTTGLYAISLAGVAALQAGTDAGVSRAQRPMQDAVSAVAAQRSALQRELASTAGTLNHASDRYAAALAEATRYHQSLGDLAKLVSAVTGTAAQIPTRLSLPAAGRPVLSVAVAPVVHATTGASGKP